MHVRSGERARLACWFAASRRNNLFCSLERNPRSAINKVRDGEDAFASTRDACAPRKPRECASGYQVPL
ncbi:MAG: hypothetical protein DME98_08735 [Verrucomicrobia bacterium]|nr:MAG: hypothetical protein DME98_08735 [Verrucomicrobiota bacterium]PYJ32613.1 MAG: hypothetical protein DME88_10570 [Verrucomicrobiota bacterium]